MRGKHGVVALLALLIVWVPTGCTEPRVQPEWEVEVDVIPRLPEEVDVLDVDTMWVYMEEARSGRTDSALSEYGQRVHFRLTGGNYNIRAFGSVPAGPVMRNFAGVRLDVALSEAKGKVDLPILESQTLNPDWTGEGQRSTGQQGDDKAHIDSSPVSEPSLDERQAP